MRWLLACMLSLSLLTACGFKLRGDYFIPERFSQLYVHSAQDHAPIERALKNRLQRFDVEVLGDLELAQELGVTGIFLQRDQLERRILSLFGTGQVAEYELLYSLTYQIRMPDRDPLEFTVELTRQFQDDPDAVLAKSRELDLIVSEMRERAAERVIRRLATLEQSSL